MYRNRDLPEGVQQQPDTQLRYAPQMHSCRMHHFEIILGRDGKPQPRLLVQILVRQDVHAGKETSCNTLACEGYR